MVLGLVTHPLLTAFPRQFDPSREGAVRAGQAHVHAAQGYAAHSPIQASALVFAAALKGLTAAVHRPTEDTGCTIFGSAHADLAVGGGAEIAEEALVWVAGVTLRTQFSQLLGADAAAAASVQHQAHAGGAARRFGCALTLRAAVLAGSRPGAQGEEHQGEADGTSDGGEHGLGAAEERTAGCRGDKRRGWRLDSDGAEVGVWTLQAVASGVVGWAGAAAVWRRSVS